MSSPGAAPGGTPNAAAQGGERRVEVRRTPTRRRAFAVFAFRAGGVTNGENALGVKAGTVEPLNHPTSVIPLRLQPAAWLSAWREETGHIHLPVSAAPRVKH